MSAVAAHTVTNQSA